MKIRFLVIIGITVIVSVFYASILMNNNTNDVIQNSQRNSIDVFQDFVNSEKRSDLAMKEWYDNLLHSDDDLANTIAILETEKEILNNLYNEYASLPDSEKTDEEIHRKIIGFKHNWLSYEPFTENLKQQKEAERDFRITLEHYGCAKTCPVYSVMINGDGTVLYKGLKNVKEIGKQEYTIQSDTLTELNPFLFEAYGDNIDKYGLHDETKNTVIITIQFGQVKRIVIHGDSGPEWLKDFEAKINEISNTRQNVFGDSFS